MRHATWGNLILFISAALIGIATAIAQVNHVFDGHLWVAWCLYGLAVLLILIWVRLSLQGPHEVRSPDSSSAPPPPLMKDSGNATANATGGAGGSASIGGGTNSQALEREQEQSLLNYLKTHPKTHLVQALASGTSLSFDDAKQALGRLFAKELVYRSSIEAPGDFVYWYDGPTTTKPELQPVERSKDWQELAEKFEKVGLDVGARWDCHRRHNQTVYENWTILGTYRKPCESLCRFAGSLLLKSPNVSPTLQESARAQSDAVYRWLFFLKENHDAISSRGLGSGIMPPVDEHGTIYLSESIANLAAISARVCTECAALEL